MQRSARPIHPVVYNKMDRSITMKVSMLTKGKFRPSGLDADGWHRILTYFAFRTTTVDLRKTFI